ncbi:MAG: tRNA (guanosine(46)-N7)-methyltransferase TrmB [Candidatus Contendobacter sp.]|jgi:tRNA (guanine-N7-)-methyltransferase|nr:tRNA (guanosine(46)-N7)-methyltransferase TrmB [Candidatus Contendobacter sp.]
MGLADISRERLPIRATLADLKLTIRSDSLQRIRSFVRRESRMTRAQQRAFAELWSRFGIDAGAARLEPEQIFGRRGPLVLEIGFGDGESLAAMAAADPETDYLGIEVHRPGIGHLLLRSTQLELSNLRILCADAMAIVEWQLPDECLDRIQIFFPDPWPKVRHHKRRLIQPSFMTLLAGKAKPAGQLLIATDCEDYARSILASLNSAPEWLNTAADHGFAPRPVQRLLTKFEQRGQRLGHVVQDLAFVRR